MFTTNLALMQNDADLVKSLLTVRDYIRLAISRFTEAGVYFGHGTDNAWDEAVSLIFYLLHLPVEIDSRVLDARLSLDERKLVIRMIETRCVDRIPVPYLTGQINFAGIQFLIDERVIIPRSPISELIEKQFQPWLKQPPENVLDLCCGSGCIGLASALHLDCNVTLADISVDALEVARKNITRLSLQTEASLVQSDLFDQLEGKFDLILSNPPYVDEEDLSSMPSEFRHEPIMALSAGKDGLEFARRILHDAQQFLTEDGFLVMELGNSWVHLEAAYPQIPWLWLEFERGGHGVLMISRAELVEYFPRQ